MGFVLLTYLHGGDKALLVKQKEEEGEVAVAPRGFGSLRERAGSSCQSWPPELSIIWPGCGVGELGVPPLPFSGGGGNRGVPTEMALPCRPRRWQVVVVVGWGKVTGRVMLGGEGTHREGDTGMSYLGDGHVGGVGGCGHASDALGVPTTAAGQARAAAIHLWHRDGSGYGPWVHAGRGTHGDVAPKEVHQPLGPTSGCSPQCWGRPQAMGMHHPLGHVSHGGPAPWISSQG